MKEKPKAALLAALILFFISIGVTCLAGCAQEETSPEAVDPQEDVAVNDGEAREIDNAEITRDKLIKKGELQLQADDVTAVSQEVEKITSEFNGFVEESSFEESNGEKLVRYTLRVPAEDFDAFIADVAELAQVSKRHTFAEDVSEQFIDLKARLEVLHVAGTGRKTDGANGRGRGIRRYNRTGTRAIPGKRTYRENPGKVGAPGKAGIILDPFSRDRTDPGSYPVPGRRVGRAPL